MASRGVYTASILAMLGGEWIFPLTKKAPTVPTGQILEIPKEFALCALLQWISSDYYKARAKRWRIARGVVWASYLALLFDPDPNESTDPDWHFKDRQYRIIRETFDSVLDLWVTTQWVSVVRTKMGRPRSADYSSGLLSRAQRYANEKGFVEVSMGDSESKVRRWGKSILGENNVKANTYYKVNSERLLTEMVEMEQLGSLEGLTKEEISEALNLPKKFISAACRELVQGGDWEIVRVTEGGERKRVVRKVATF